MLLKKLTLAAVAAACVLLAAAPSNAEVVVLTDDTFEHDTQISTGATTGDWFIKFYAPWCGFCKQIAPEWEKLADKLEDSNVNVAKVDCTKNRLTCERFGVRGYPSLFFFHNGQVFKYNGARDATSLAAYALGGWEEDNGETAPSAPSFFQQKLLELDEALAQIHLHDDPTTNAILIGLVLAGIIAAVMIIFFIVILCLCCPPESDASLREQDEQQDKQQSSDNKKEDGEENDDEKRKTTDDDESVSGGDAKSPGKARRRRKAEQ